MWPFLKVGGGAGTDREVAVVANLSARVSSVGDNRLGGWHSYRASKTALNQCLVSFCLFILSFVFFCFWLVRLHICTSKSPSALLKLFNFYFVRGIFGDF